MSLVNKVFLIGNLGKDPEIRTIDSGVKVATFSLATNERYTTKEGEKKTLTEWHDVQAWRGLAEVAEKHFKKGDKIAIEGKLKHRKYDDKDGVTRYVTDVIMMDFEFMGSKTSDNGKFNNLEEPPTESKADWPPNTKDTPAVDLEDDDLPF